jgi:glycosyltransferase 2 family protein
MKRAGILALQLLVTAAGIFYVFHDVHKRHQVAEALRHSDWNWLLIGWLCYGAVEVLATVRWQILLRVQDIVLGWLRTWAIVVIGLFFNMFLPGLVGGDVVRLYFVFKQVPGKKARATLSVVMDRLVGLISLLCLALLVMIFRLGSLSGSPATAHVTDVAVAVLGASFVAMILLFAVVGLGLLDRLPQRMPFRKSILQAGEALDIYRTHLPLTLAALVVTFLSHLAYYMSYYCAFRSLTGAAAQASSILDFFSIMPLVNAITGVPISFGGTGVRETLFQTLLGHLTGVPGAVAAFAASLGFAIQASWGIVGAAAYLFTRSSNSRGNKDAPSSSVAG